MAITISGNMIQMPQGDTGPVAFVVKRGEATTEDTGVFTLAQRDGMPILRKVIAPSGNTFHMMFTYADTAKLRPDNYRWSFRVLRNPQFDTHGNLLNTQGQHTPVMEGRMMIFPVAGGVR